MIFFKKYGYSLLLLALAFHIETYAQTFDEEAYKRDKKLLEIAIKNDIPPLNLGQKVPDIKNIKILEYASKSIALSEFKGKVIILDFWSQYCSSCIAAFPKMQALQEQFKDNLIILPTTYQTEQSILRVRERLKKFGKEMKLPSIVEDTILRRYFRHTGEPFLAWINPDGKVIGFTDSRGASENIISDVIKGNYSNLESISVDPATNNFDGNGPIVLKSDLSHDNTNSDSLGFEYRSTILKYNKLIRIGLVANLPEKIGNYYYFRIYNRPVLEIFKWAFGSKLSGMYDPLNKRLIYEGSTEYFKNWDWIRSENPIERNNFMQDNYYSYESISPSHFFINEIEKHAQLDLESFFKVKVSREFRKIKVLALIRSSTNDKLNFKIKPGYIKEEYYPDLLSFTIKKAQLSTLVFFMNNSLKGIPLIVDETNYNENVNIFFELPKVYDLSTVQKALAKYDLELKPVEREVEVMIIRKEDGGDSE